LMLRLLFIHPSNTGKYKIVINTVERKGRWWNLSNWLLYKIRDNPNAIRNESIKFKFLVFDKILELYKAICIKK
jgi:hypothetical protein